MNKFVKKGLFIILMLLFVDSFFNIKVVLADESMNDKIEVYGNYKVYVNDEEVTNYELINDNNIKINQEYNGGIEGCYFDNSEEFFLDYSNKLYGNYNYKFSLICNEQIVDSRDITINYVGNNSDLINTRNIYYYDNTYFILKDTDNELRVLDIIDMFDDNIDTYNASLSILDENGEILLDNEIVENGYKLRLSATYLEYDNTNYVEEEFFINLVGDVNEDGVINDFDIKCLFVDDVIDGNIDIKDVVNIGNDNIVNGTDTLNKNVLYDDEVFIDSEFDVRYYINGFESDSLNGVFGKINYDMNTLELVSVIVDNGYGMYTDDGRFMYLVNGFNKDGLFITFRFRTLMIGNTNISLDRIDFTTDGGSYANVDEPLFSSDILALEYGKGGDVEENNKNEVNKVDIFDKKVQLGKKEESTSNFVEVYEELLPSKSIKHISLSTDNYIKSLKIKGYDIEFDKDIFEYFIKVDSSVTELNLEIELNDKDSYYVVIGNKDFKKGNNEVSIVVTSLDGSVKTYVINVEKDEDVLTEKSDIDKEKETSRNIIILLIILIIIGLVYIIFKDDDK